MLRWFAAHQHSDGAIPSSPIYGGTQVLFDYNAYWITTLFNYVLYSGDLGLARALWPNVTKLVDVVRRSCTAKRLARERPRRP